MHDHHVAVLDVVLSEGAETGAKGRFLQFSRGSCGFGDFE